MGAVCDGASALRSSRSGRASARRGDRTWTRWRGRSVDRHHIGHRVACQPMTRFGIAGSARAAGCSPLTLLLGAATCGWSGARAAWPTRRHFAACGTPWLTRDARRLHLARAATSAVPHGSRRAQHGRLDAPQEPGKFAGPRSAGAVGEGRADKISALPPCYIALEVNSGRRLYGPDEGLFVDECPCKPGLGCCCRARQVRSTINVAPISPTAACPDLPGSVRTMTQTDDYRNGRSACTRCRRLVGGSPAR